MIIIQKNPEFYFNIVDNDGAVSGFTQGNGITDSFNLKAKLNDETGNNGTKNVEIMVLLKYQSNTWRTLEIPLINCEITLNLNWSKNYIIVATYIADQDTIFSITDTKRYVPLITLSTQDNAKLLE